jgi:hypothetical protein
MEHELSMKLRFTADRFVLATSPLRLTTSNFIFQLNTYSYSPYVTSSLIHNCCWSSPGQSFSDHSLVGLITTFYCLQFEIPPTWWARSPHLYPPGTGWPGYTPRQWVPFSLPPTTRRAMEKVFDSTSIRDPARMSHRCQGNFGNYTHHHALLE